MQTGAGAKECSGHGVALAACNVTVDRTIVHEWLFDEKQVVQDCEHDAQCHLEAEHGESPG